MIQFNNPFITGSEIKYIKEAFDNGHFCGDGVFTRKCDSILQEITRSKKVLLTTSCTHALEMAALLADIGPGDEVIMPSFTFVSTANAFALRGAKIVFVDIRPDTMNIDENKIEAAISSKTKAIVPVHYGGVSCEMDLIMELAARYNLIVIEDAAQGLGSYYKGKPLGSIGHLGAISFHETKNIHCGEGGAIVINDEKYLERSEIIREKGTNRSKFLRGQIDKYSWVDIGSSYLPSELNAAFLMAQLEQLSNSIKYRLIIWDTYFKGLGSLVEEGLLELPYIPEGCIQNGHMFYIKVKDIEQRQNLISYLKRNEIQVVFHYIPLHSSIEGTQITSFSGKDEFTTKESERILRLPMHYNLSPENIDYVITCIMKFFKNA
jgi:dTDP-4-amino-4,6-dideoxygalactose transaminase